MDTFSIIKRRLKLIFIVDKLSFCQYPYQILFQWPVFKGSVAALQIFKWCEKSRDWVLYFEKKKKNRF